MPLIDHIMQITSMCDCTINTYKDSQHKWAFWEAVVDQLEINQNSTIHK